MTDYVSLDALSRGEELDDFAQVHADIVMPQPANGNKKRVRTSSEKLL
ncbi:MAG: hypothetical protein IK089_07975 [Oxalobacter sp.]|nr:hypothetical protein [Oxalobacter sp.]